MQKEKFKNLQYIHEYVDLDEAISKKAKKAKAKKPKLLKEINGG